MTQPPEVERLATEVLHGHPANRVKDVFAMSDVTIGEMRAALQASPATAPEAVTDEILIDRAGRAICLEIMGEEGWDHANNASRAHWKRLARIAFSALPPHAPASPARHQRVALERDAIIEECAKVCTDRAAAMRRGADIHEPRNPEAAEAKRTAADWVEGCADSIRHRFYGHTDAKLIQSSVASGERGTTEEQPAPTPEPPA